MGRPKIIHHNNTFTGCWMLYEQAVALKMFCDACDDENKFVYKVKQRTPTPITAKFARMGIAPVTPAHRWVVTRKVRSHMRDRQRFVDMKTMVNYEQPLHRAGDGPNPYDTSPSSGRTWIEEGSGYAGPSLQRLGPRPDHVVRQRAKR